MDKRYEQVKPEAWKYFTPLKSVGGSKHMAQHASAEKALKDQGLYTIHSEGNPEWVWAKLPTTDGNQDVFPVTIKYLALAELLFLMHEELQDRAIQLMAIAHDNGAPVRPLLEHLNPITVGWVDPASRDH